MPRGGSSPEAAYAAYRERVPPFGVGNRHPHFLGWVHGGGTDLGMLAELLAAGLNANCGGRDHAPIACERQVIGWAAEMLGLPATSSGLLVTGTSIANFMAVLVARAAAVPGARQTGVAPGRLTAYASAAAHMCVARALDMAGLGADCLRVVPCDAAGRMQMDALGVAAMEVVPPGLGLRGCGCEANNPQPGAPDGHP